MLSIIWSKKKGSSFEGPCRGSDEEGLRILEKLDSGNSNAVVTIMPIFYLNQMMQSKAGFSNNDHQYSYSFLKSCHLCHKPLSLDKEVYMYRGDLGFCSVDCRNRQIYLDEMKKIAISTKRILASFHQRRRDGGGRCVTSKLLEENFHQRRRPFSPQTAIFVDFFIWVVGVAQFLHLGRSGLEFSGFSSVFFFREKSLEFGAIIEVKLPTSCLWHDA
ncbi:hypothetical protein Pfo_012334 [Paulownia fortunei]|nr:hypothetical protein Pfo_012334 [Paulownia fortunei]